MTDWSVLPWRRHVGATLPGPEKPSGPTGQSHGGFFRKRREEMRCTATGTAWPATVLIDGDGGSNGPKYWDSDLGEMNSVDFGLRLLSRGRWNVLSFRDEDHLDPPATDLRADIRAHLRRQGVDPSGWQVTLVANARVLGYVFDPASFYLCRDRAGRLRIVLIEVHNTHGERHLYTLDRSDPTSETFEAAMDKDFYVSPFIGMAGRFPGAPSLAES